MLRRPRRAEPAPERQPAIAATGKRKKRSDRPAPVPAPLPDRRPAGRAAWYRFLPYVGIVALVVLVITWDYLLNQSGARSAGTVLLNAFTTRFDTGSRIVTPSSALIVLLLFTWGVAAVLAVTEHLNECPAGAEPFTMGSVHVAASLGVFLLYGLIQAGRTLLSCAAADGCRPSPGESHHLFRRRAFAAAAPARRGAGGRAHAGAAGRAAAERGGAGHRRRGSGGGGSVDCRQRERPDGPGRHLLQAGARVRRGKLLG